MTELQTRCLETFPEWLRALATDASDLGQVIGLADAPEPARRFVAGGLNYLFKSLDLIPDGIEDLGYLDDAFVLRVAASLALEAAPTLRASAPAVARLSSETRLIRELLDKDYDRLERFVRGLTQGAARGRTVSEIIEDAAVRAAFVDEVKSWASSYDCPSFARDEKNLVKLQSFLAAKLPA
jgi:uncharacterized membrane protein YkvA (DUF1232 family)